MARLRTRLLVLALLAGGSTNCLLDTGPINMPPTVQIDEPNQSLHRGDKVTFTATIHDPDQSNDSLDIAWHVGADADCDTAVASALGSCTSQQSNDQCSYIPQAFGSVCVVVQVKDRYGATAETRRAFNVEDRPPTAVISPASIAGPLPLSSNLTFSAASSTDPDKDDALTYAWTVTQPDGTTLTATTCLSPQTGDTCSFQAASPGTYHVKLVATDSSGATSAPASVDVAIDKDQPPCIDINGLQPKALQTIAFSDQGITFIVGSVRDDLDFYPQISGTTFYGTFTWWYRSGTSGGFARLSNPYSSNQLYFGPGVFVTGDAIQVRVEYQDRMNRSFSSCDQNAERCELVPGCAQWVTWTVQFL